MFLCIAIILLIKEPIKLSRSPKSIQTIGDSLYPLLLELLAFLDDRLLIDGHVNIVEILDGHVISIGLTIFVLLAYLAGGLVQLFAFFLELFLQILLLLGSKTLEVWLGLINTTFCLFGRFIRVLLRGFLGRQGARNLHV